MLIATAVVSAYQLLVCRSDRGKASEGDEACGPRFVLLVGPTDARIAHDVALRTHGRVQAWSTTNGGVPPWSVEDAMAALAGSTTDEVVVLADPDGLRTIPVHRG